MSMQLTGNIRDEKKLAFLQEELEKVREKDTSSSLAKRHKREKKRF